jgi:outer membrane protein TolC
MIPKIGKQLLLKTFPIFLTLLILSCASIDARQDFADATSLVDARLQGEDIPTSAWDQQSPLSTGEAVATAIMNDALLKRDMAIIVEHHGEYTKAGLLPNPTISGALGIAIDGMSGAPIIMQGMQGLGWLWTRPDRIASAEASLQQAVLSAANRAISLASTVRTTHAHVYYSQASLELALEDQETAKRAVSLVSSLKDAGEATQSDVDEALLKLAKSKTVVVEGSDEVENNKLALLSSMGIPSVSTKFEVLQPQLESLQDSTTEDELLALATLNRFDLAAKQSRVVQRSAELGFANPPNITATVAFRENFGNREALVPGASIVIPLDGEANEAIADAKLAQAQLEYTNAFRIAQHEVRRALQKYRSAGDKIRITSDEVVNLARGQHKRALQLKESGELNPLSLIPIKRQLIAADLLALKHQEELIVARINLQLAVGGTFQGPTPTDIADVTHPTKGFEQ